MSIFDREVLWILRGFIQVVLIPAQSTRWGVPYDRLALRLGDRALWLVRPLGEEEVREMAQQMLAWADAIKEKSHGE